MCLPSAQQLPLSELNHQCPGPAALCHASKPAPTPTLPVICQGNVSFVNDRPAAR